MNYSSLPARTVSTTGRLDAGFFLASGNQAALLLMDLRVKGLLHARLGEPDGLAKVWQPDRFKRAYAAELEPKLPYLRPYDVFSFLPTAADYLSAARNSKIDTYKLREGMILQSCSGRNLGPAVMVDKYLAEFLIGDDMLRIEVRDEDLRFYVLTFLRTHLGQALLRWGKTGSVIDHISDKHVSSMDIPLVPDRDLADISALMQRAVSTREKSRLTLNSVQQLYETRLPKLTRPKGTHLGWSIRKGSVGSRLDADSYDPLVEQVRRDLKALAALPLEQVATVMKPGGRYKTNYVSPQHGTPLLSGTQLLQHLPINLQYLAPSVLSRQQIYELEGGWLAYQADGRAEETLGLPVVITSDRDGWLASGHVGRIVPKPGTRLGWLYTALRTLHAQIQIKSRASGSVVDATFVEDMEQVILPPFFEDIAWQDVEDAWEGFAVSTQLENQAIRKLERLLGASSKNLV